MANCGKFFLPTAAPHPFTTVPGIPGQKEGCLGPWLPSNPNPPWDFRGSAEMRCCAGECENHHPPCQLCSSRSSCLFHVPRWIPGRRKRPGPALPDCSARGAPRLSQELLAVTGWATGVEGVSPDPVWPPLGHLHTAAAGPSSPRNRRGPPPEAAPQRHSGAEAYRVTLGVATAAAAHTATALSGEGPPTVPPLQPRAWHPRPGRGLLVGPAVLALTATSRFVHFQSLIKLHVRKPRTALPAWQ